MNKQTLFSALCEVADALQAECVRLDFSPLKIALEAILGRLDVIIDDVVQMQTETLEDDNDA